MKTFGRYTIMVNYEENDLLSLLSPDKLDELDKKIINILQQAESIHQKNKEDTLYLKGYLYGDQDIKNKIKHTREEINNKTTENWVWAFVDFKKAYLLGKPIQYVQLNEGETKEISTLNQYVRYAQKKAKDMQIYQDALVCGRGFRYVNKNKNFSDGQAPFEIINCNPEDTEVVYSSKLGNEQLFAYIETDMIDYQTVTDDRGELVIKEVPYQEYTVYLRKAVLTYIASRLTQSEIDALNKNFQEIDNNNDGKLTLEEIKLAASKNKGINLELIEEIFKSIDTDGSGSIEYTEFISASLDKSLYLQKEKLREAFNLFDFDHSGKISNAEIAKVLGMDKRSKEISKILEKYDTNKDGEIDFEEFFEMMKDLS